MKPLGTPGNAIEQLAEEALAGFEQIDTAGATYEMSVGSVVSPVHRGVESACFNVEQNGQLMFLKVRYPDMRGFFDEMYVHEGAKRACKLGAGPLLMDAKLETGCYLFEHLGEGWRWGKVDDFQVSSVLENTVSAKKAIHDSASFGFGKSVFEKVEEYFETAAKENIALPETVAPVLTKVRQCASALQASGFSTVACHGDGVASNVMISGSGSVRLVDFDSAGDHDPYFDLGSLIVEVAQFPGLAGSVLEIYEGECRQAAFNRCMLYGIADDLKWALWGFISFARSPRKQVEFVKYAEWRLLRSRWNAEGPHFENWIGKL